MNKFTYVGDKFYRNGQPHNIYSGAIHYFRIVPECWRDRLMKLKNAGFNTVETYVCWSLHERQEGVFDFTGRLDLAKFIDEATSLDLDVIIRPGPFICAETDFGGLPSWLLKYPNMKLRCDNECFLEKVYNYFKAIAPILKPRLIENGGRIIMMQIENEYGSFGNDKVYLQKLVNLYKKLQFNCLYFTADGVDAQMIEGGTIPNILQGLTFGSTPIHNFSRHNPKEIQPKFCAEYWSGWFDVYGEEHHVRDDESVCKETAEFIESNASFNFYMFCGGTNFGMSNGANYIAEKYSFQTTSYDYNAPITESGDMTAKYFKLKSLMERLTGKKCDLPVENSKKKAYLPLTAQGFASLTDNLPQNCLGSSYPMSFEELGVDFGYALYSTTLRVAEQGELYLRNLRDRAVVLINGEIACVMDNSLKESKLVLNQVGQTIKLDILVENCGRCNYGYQLCDSKGILGGVIYHYKFVMGFKQYPLVAELPKNINYREIEKEDGKKIGFYKFTLNVSETPCDTFINPNGFANGCIYVNGVNVGRYNNKKPPQKTLYIPAPLLKKGENQIVVFETDGTVNPTISFSEQPIYSSSMCRD